jgi:L-erythro-3,5-diaminohexanoate dehydrogenase
VRAPGSPIGLHRVLDPPGVLPWRANRLDDSPELWPDEVRIAVERLDLDAASFRQFHGAYLGDGDGIRGAVLDIVAARGKLQNPVTGSGGTLIGTVAEVGRESPLGLSAGQRVTTMVSLTLIPLRITDGLRRWDGQDSRVPAAGHAILFGRSAAVVLPDDLTPALALAVLDVCGTPVFTARTVGRYAEVAGDPDAGRHRGAAGTRGQGTRGQGAGGRTGSPGLPTSPGPPTVAVLGAAGVSGALAVAAAKRAGAGRTAGVVSDTVDRDRLERAGLADVVAVADTRSPVELSAAVAEVLGGPADVVVCCVDAPGCEDGAVLATAQGGTVIFCSAMTSAPGATLGAAALAADVTMLLAGKYVAGHADFALHLLRTEPAVRELFADRVAHETPAVGAVRG